MSSSALPVPPAQPQQEAQSWDAKAKRELLVTELHRLAGRALPRDEMGTPRPDLFHGYLIHPALVTMGWALGQYARPVAEAGSKYHHQKNSPSPMVLGLKTSLQEFVQASRNPAQREQRTWEAIFRQKEAAQRTAFHLSSYERLFSPVQLTHAAERLGQPHLRLVVHLLFYLAQATAGQGLDPREMLDPIHGVVVEHPNGSRMCRVPLTGAQLRAITGQQTAALALPIISDLEGMRWTEPVIEQVQADGTLKIERWPLPWIVNATELNGRPIRNQDGTIERVEMAVRDKDRVVIWLDKGFVAYAYALGRMLMRGVARDDGGRIVVGWENRINNPITILRDKFMAERSPFRARILLWDALFAGPYKTSRLLDHLKNAVGGDEPIQEQLRGLVSDAIEHGAPFRDRLEEILRRIQEGEARHATQKEARKTKQAVVALETPSNQPSLFEEVGNTPLESAENTRETPRMGLQLGNTPLESAEKALVTPPEDLFTLQLGKPPLESAETSSKIHRICGGEELFSKKSAENSAAAPLATSSFEGTCAEPTPPSLILQESNTPTREETGREDRRFETPTHPLSSHAISSLLDLQPLKDSEDEELPLGEKKDSRSLSNLQAPQVQGQEHPSKLQEQIQSPSPEPETDNPLLGMALRPFWKGGKADVLTASSWDASWFQAAPAGPDFPEAMGSLLDCLAPSAWGTVKTFTLENAVAERMFHRAGKPEEIAAVVLEGVTSFATNRQGCGLLVRILNGTLNSPKDEYRALVTQYHLRRAKTQRLAQKESELRRREDAGFYASLATAAPSTLGQSDPLPEDPFPDQEQGDDEVNPMAIEAWEKITHELATILPAGTFNDLTRVSHPVSHDGTRLFVHVPAPTKSYADTMLWEEIDLALERAGLSPLQVVFQGGR